MSWDVIHDHGQGMTDAIATWVFKDILGTKVVKMKTNYALL